MGLIRDRHGTYCARKKVPKGLEASVAQVLANGKLRQRWLKKSLGTKSPHEAKVRAKPVLIDFDRTIERARDLLKQQPTRKSLSPTEITRMAEYHYATVLANDAAVRREGRQVAAKFRECASPLGTPAFGLTDDQFERIGNSYAAELKSAQAALARGNIEYITPDLDELLELFGIRLDPSTAAYRSLGSAVLTACVKALQAVQRRHAGEPVETPRQPDITETGTPEGDTLRAAFQGWQKARNPAPGTLSEYERAIRLFTELHGDMPVVNIKRSHARQYRETLQDVPKHRQGDLLKASLPELADWGRKHLDAVRLSKGTINKLLGGVQAIGLWARDQGLIPDDVPWSDPFARMRLEEDEPDREPFTTAELKLLFASPVFTQGERPEGGKGEAAYWLPLLGLFTGARRGELAGLTVADVVSDETTARPVLLIREDESRSRSLKTPGSARSIPLHSELIRLGFMQFAHERRRTAGDKAWLFPEIAPDCKGGVSAWTKWFSRYIRTNGVTDTRKVFHSFRHNFKDALRAAKVSEDLNDALTGHGTRGSVGRSYGSRDIVIRYGMPTLIEAVARVVYSNLDLSSVTAVPCATSPAVRKRAQGPRRTHRRTHNQS
jgi:integrase